MQKWGMGHRFTSKFTSLNRTASRSRIITCCTVQEKENWLKEHQGHEVYEKQFQAYTIACQNENVNNFITVRDRLQVKTDRL